MLGHSVPQLYIILILTLTLFSRSGLAMEPKESAVLHAAMRAIQFGYIKELELELKNGGNPDEILNTGMPLLCMIGHWKNMGESAVMEVSKCLLDAKANIDAQTLRSKNTALHIAIEYGCFAHAKELIARGASLMLPNKIGDTPLMMLERYTEKEAQELIPNKICYSNNK